MTEIVKRGRGRPPGSKNKNSTVAPKAAVIVDGVKRGRGRPPGSKNKATVTVEAIRQAITAPAQAPVTVSQAPPVNTPKKAEIVYIIPDPKNPRPQQAWQFDVVMNTGISIVTEDDMDPEIVTEYGGIDRNDCIRTMNMFNRLYGCVKFTDPMERANPTSISRWGFKYELESLRGFRRGEG